ncbi:two-component sensor histidine kinase [Hasllibacter halocynthiae]|uniref:histidine kinase n=1 Tax=Hasllibacter halocynthiae TaxID=595589 RepID=A0A2T0X6X1_9RHOB|nr:GAF domain-containing protein [Hasllibacter halocynthiae]PRY94700.1 two-component sensor histidine kinase [Hasllibacter halocynthiae]
MNDRIHGGEAGTSGRAPDELAGRLRQQKLLADFGAFALCAGSFHEVADEAVRVAAEGLDVRLAKYLHFREAEGDLLMLAGTGWGPGVVGSATFSADPGSPAGYAWQKGEAAMANDLPSDGRFRTPPLLAERGVRRAINVPVKDSGHPFGVLEGNDTAPGMFTQADADFLQGMANVLSGAIFRERRERELRAAEMRQTLLADEMRHRVKNLFSVVQAVISLSRREASRNGASDPLALLTGRIDALRAAGEAGLSGTRGAVPTAEGGGWVDPIELSRHVLGAYGDRIEIEGGAPALTSGQAGPVAIILHELAINALKYGALSVPEGRVSLCWNAAEGALLLLWREVDGPRVLGPPEDSGFGLGLMRRIAAPLGADLSLDWSPPGLAVTLRMMPEARPAAA